MKNKDKSFHIKQPSMTEQLMIHSKTAETCTEMIWNFKLNRVLLQ